MPVNVGVCLSGGGFRAAFYGVGVLRYLAEAGKLDAVGPVSAVSGGSVAAAMLAARYDRFRAAGGDARSFVSSVEEPLRHVACTTSIRDTTVLRTGLNRLRPRSSNRTAVLGHVLDEHLFERVALGELPRRPQAVITTTDLTAGRAFRLSRDFIGSYDHGYGTSGGSLPVGTACAASAAAPFALPPLRLATAGMGLKDATPAVLALADGGVYDNLGLEWFQGWGSGRPPAALPADFRIVVDAAGPINRRRTPRTTPGALWRVKGIQYAQTRTVRTRWFVEHLINGTEHGLYLSLGRHPSWVRLPGGEKLDPATYMSALPTEFAPALAALRTDFDKFLPEEVDLLEYHAYWSTHAMLRGVRPDLAIQGEPEWRTYADLSARDQNSLLRLLADGRRHWGPGRTPGWHRRKS